MVGRREDVARSRRCRGDNPNSRRKAQLIEKPCLDATTNHPSAKSGDARIGKPDVRGQLSCRPEHIDGHAAARMPVAADAEIDGFEHGRQTCADRDRDLLVKAAVVAEGGKGRTSAASDSTSHARGT